MLATYIWKAEKHFELLFWGFSSLLLERWSRQIDSGMKQAELIKNDNFALSKLHMLEHVQSNQLNIFLNWHSTQKSELFLWRALKGSLTFCHRIFGSSIENQRLLSWAVYFWFSKCYASFSDTNIRKTIRTDKIFNILGIT